MTRGSWFMVGWVLELAGEGLVEDGGQEFCFDGNCGFGYCVVQKREIR